MFRKRLLILFLTCWSASSFKLNEKIAPLDKHDSQNLLSANDALFREKFAEQKTVTRLSESENIVNRSLTYMDDLNIWDPYNFAKNWNREFSNVSLDCGEDLTLYAASLLAEQQWALKMIDASGRYTWALFSGNAYWLGAVDQCREMQAEFKEWQRDTKIQRQGDVPPFSVGMFSAVLNLTLQRPPLHEAHRIFLGLCLPSSCDAADAGKLLNFVQDRRGNDTSAKVTVANVRVLSRGYSLTEDPVFYALLVTFVAVLVFVTLGTFYDISLRYEVLRAEKISHGMGNTMTEMKVLNADDSAGSEITMARLWSVKEHNGALDVYSTDTAPKPLSEALLSFSLLLNLSKVFSYDVGADTLAPIHGLRFLSMLWIILVHTCLTVNVVSEGEAFKSRAEQNFLYQTISNGTYAVDTFFFMSGCLVSFLYFRMITKDNMRKKKLIRGGCGRILQFLAMVWYRYFRLTPVYLLVIGLIQVSMSWYYDNTMLELYTLDYENCRKFWWRNVLYINTYFAMDERCIVWSWYLANDTLFYTIGIIILIIGARLLPLAGFMTISILIASWITTAAIALNVDHVPSIQDPFAHYESLYDKPWSRIGPYLFGMMTGWYLYKSNCKLRINRTISLVLWTLSFVAMLSIVYGLYGSMYGPFLSAIYTALSHSGWAISIAWVLIACVTGHGEVVNKILSWKCLYPLSRLTYCAYLVHPAIIRAVILHGESSMHLSQGLMAILFLGFAVASYAVSLFISLFFEAPMVSLLRIVHPLRQWKKNK